MDISLCSCHFVFVCAKGGVSYFQSIGQSVQGCIAMYERNRAHCSSNGSKES